MRAIQVTWALALATLLAVSCADAWADDGRVVGARAVAVAPPPAAGAASAVDTSARAAHAAGAAPAPRPLARAAASGGVTIRDFAFHPATSTVHVGDTISWTNEDAAPHTATADDGSFDTGTLAQGRSGAHTFTGAGTFAYHCAIHPSMRGTVTVLAPTGAAPVPAERAPAAAAPAAVPASSAPTLPNTGVDALDLALAGLAALLAGLALRRVAAR